MLPLTKIYPKEMLPLGSKPLLHHTISNFYNLWFRDFLFILWPHKELIHDYFSYADIDHDDIRSLNQIISDSKIDFIQDEYKGTWWSLLAVQDSISDDYFFLIFGDIYIDQDQVEDMMKLHDGKHQVALVTKVDPSYKTRYKQTIIWSDGSISDTLATPDEDDQDMNIIWWVFILHKDIFDYIKDIIDFTDKEKEFWLIRPLQNMLDKHSMLWYIWSAYDIWNVQEWKKTFTKFD